LETTPRGPGELFTLIIKDQFQRVRDADRFWFENRGNGLLTDEEFNEINSTTFYDIITRNTNITAIQRDVFHFRAGDPCPQPKQLSQFDLEQCVPMQTYDYFSPSENQIGGYWAAVGAFFILTLLSIWIAHRREQAIASEDALVLNAKLNALSIQQSFNPGVAVPDDQELIHAKTGAKSKLIGAVIFSQLYGTVPVYVKVESESVKNEEKGAPVAFLHIFDAHKNLLLKVPLNAVPRLLVSQAPVSSAAAPSRGPSLAHRLSSRTASQRLIDAGASHLEQYSVIVPASGIDDIWLVFRNEIARETFIDMVQSQAPVRLLVDNQVLISHYLQEQVQETKAKIRIVREMLGQTVRQILGKTRPQLSEEFANASIMIRVGDLADALEVPSSDVFVTHLFRLADTQRMGVISLQQLFDVVASIDSSNTKLGEFSEKEIDSSQGHTRQSVAAARTFSTRTLQNTEDEEYEQAPVADFNQKRSLWSRWRRYARNYGPHIYIMILWFTTLFGVFFERFYTIGVEREHMGHRRAVGYSFAISRGSASVIMRNIAILLLTVCYNTLTFLRNTWIAHYIPLNAAGKFHGAIGWNTFIFIWIHIVAEAVSWYQLATQPTEDLRCLFREVYFYSDQLPGWVDWYLASFIGLTGTGLILLVILMFSYTYFRDKAFHTFLIVHKVAFAIYGLLLLHGTAQIIQEPIFWAYLVGPGGIYIIDKTVSAARHERFVKVVSAELLTPTVTKLVFERPDGFGYKSGQYVKIACDPISQDAYHPFSLTSAAQEDVLSIHIRSVGDWTRRIRDVFHPENLKPVAGSVSNIHGRKLAGLGHHTEEEREGDWAIDYARSNHVHAYPIVVTCKTHDMPFLRVDGPFSSGQQQWDSFSTVVLVGEGIGVTPFASIIKDFIYRIRASGNNIAKSPLKKLYLVWICESDAEFEWFTDTIRKAEKLDVNGVLDVQIFRTDRIENNNLQGALLHLFEGSFQKSSTNSISPFTGLRGVVNFGKPDFFDLLRAIAARHYGTHIGLFSAGQPKFNTAVNAAALEQNQFPHTKFHHFIENFW
jgi:dual oxidase